jgi:Tat protein secretion system quality control protein TatD with DNase activity
MCPGSGRCHHASLITQGKAPVQDQGGVITHHSSHREKLLSRIRAVSDDRWLLESDQDSPSRIDPGLESMLGIVAEAKGWTVEKTATVAIENFNSFNSF